MDGVGFVNPRFTERDTDGRMENDLSVSLPADSSPERGAKRKDKCVSLGSPSRGAVTQGVTERSFSVITTNAIFV